MVDTTGPWLARPASPFHAEETPMTSAETIHDFVDVGHTRVSYTRTGSGPDLLFIHGWPLNGSTWRHVTPHLEGFTRWVIDLPGAGASVATDQTPLSVAAHAETVASVIDALGLSEVTLVGNDSGGMVARFAAEKRPEAVNALALCGTEIPGHHPWLVTMFTTLAKLPGAKAMFRFSMGNRFIAKTPLILGNTVADKSLLDGEFRETVLDPILANDAHMTAAVKLIRGFSKADVDPLAETHRNLKMPTLLVAGEGDPFFPAEEAREMMSQFAGPTEFVTFENCKLLVQEDQPQRFADQIRSFLEAQSIH